jgi:glycosyltransferase involved in cell wall biosynthesis
MHNFTPPSIPPKIAVAITTFNEIEQSGGQWLRENIDAMLMSPHIGDIVVVNDGTPDYPELGALLYQWFGTRVRVQQNLENLGVFGNKLTSLAASRGEWCLIADSDNVFPAGFFDRLMEFHPWERDVAYVASVGRVEFDYRPFIGDWTLENATEIPTKPCGWCLCNCGNWFVNRERFLSAFDGIPRSRFDQHQPNYFNADDRSDWHWRLVYDAMDSFYINKTWWLNGGTLRVVNGLEYVHRVDRAKPGNYDRSPVDKMALGPIYVAELIDAAVGEKHDYTLLQQTGNSFYLSRGDGATVIVDFHTGEVQVCPAEAKAETVAETVETSPADSSQCENSAPAAVSETNFSRDRSLKPTRRNMGRRGR